MIFIVPCVHEIKNSSAESIQFNYAVNLLFLPLRISKVSERSLFCRESIFIPCTQLFPTRTLMQFSFLVFVPPQEQLNSILSWILHSGFHPQQQRLPTHGYNENNIWPFSRCSWFHGATQSVHVVPGISIKCKRQRSHRQMHNGSTPRNGNGIPQEGTLFSKQSIRMRVTRRIMRKF